MGKPAAENEMEQSLQFDAAMSKPIPTISTFMTPMPESIGSNQTLAKAKEVMHSRNIRHLPALEGGTLVGLVSDRDIALVETLKDVDPRHVLVADTMTTNLYTVAPDVPLDSVAAEMAEHKYGSALVVDRGKVVGIFTTTDVCRALAELLRTPDAAE
jgi:acetoin utilization protein AcuB